MEERIQIDIVIYSEGKGKNKVYSIRSVQIPNVVTQGKTIEEAKIRLKEALNLYFYEVPWEKRLLIKEIKKESNAPMISRIFL